MQLLLSFLALWLFLCHLKIHNSFFLILENVEEADVLAVYLRWGNNEVYLPSEISRL